MSESLGIPEPLEGRVWRHGPPHRGMEMHRHRELELNLVFAGRATYIVDGRRYDLAPGSLIWLFPVQDHLLVDQSPDFRMWILVARPRLLEWACREPATRPMARDEPPPRFCRTLDAGEARRLEALLAEVAAADGAGDHDRTNAGLAWALHAAWHAFNGAEDGAASGRLHPAVDRAARRLRDETRPLSNEALADHCGLSAGRLSRLFKRQTGVALSLYRNRLRLERFFLVYGVGETRTITEAAFAAGFGSYPQFHRVFRRETGMSPAEHRDRLRGGSDPR